MPRKYLLLKEVRLRRTRTDIREALLESALIEFGAKGFDGASTRAIAQRVEAHQPQINYHFESKAARGPPQSTTSSRFWGRPWTAGSPVATWPASMRRSSLRRLRREYVAS